MAWRKEKKRYLGTSSVSLVVFLVISFSTSSIVNAFLCVPGYERQGKCIFSEASSVGNYVRAFGKPASKSNLVGVELAGNNHARSFSKTIHPGRTRTAQVFFAQPSEQADQGSPTPPKMTPEVKLLVSLLIDFIGISSFAAPGVGEATDFAWAPLSAALVQYLYGNGLISALALVEEALPGLDFIPTATLGWVLENLATNTGQSSRNTEQTARVGDSSPFTGNKKSKEQRADERVPTNYVDAELSDGSGSSSSSDR